MATSVMNSLIRFAFVLGLVTVVVVVVVVAPQGQMAMAQSQNCTSELPNLLSCQPYVLPGSPSPPSSQCCSAISEVDHACICNTLRIVSSLPSQCHLPSITCSS